MAISAYNIAYVFAEERLLLLRTLLLNLVVLENLVVFLISVDNLREDLSYFISGLHQP